MVCLSSMFSKNSSQCKYKAVLGSYVNICERTDGSKSQGHVVIIQMDLWCRHMQQLFRAYESCRLGWELNVNLACNPLCWAPFRRHYKQYLVWAHKHFHPFHIQSLLTVLLGRPDPCSTTWHREEIYAEWNSISCSATISCFTATSLVNAFAPLIFWNSELQGRYREIKIYILCLVVLFYQHLVTLNRFTSTLVSVN